MKGNIVKLSAQIVRELFVMHALKYRKNGYLFKDTIRLAATTLSKIHLCCLHVLKIVLVSAYDTQVYFVAFLTRTCYRMIALRLMLSKKV